MTRQQTREFILSLPARQSACLLLATRDKLKNEQIADLLSIGVCDVRDALTEGLATLTQAVRKKNEGRCTCRK